VPQLISKRYGEIRRKKKAGFPSFKWLNCTQAKIEIIIDIDENLMRNRKIVGQPVKPGVSALWHNLAMASSFDRECTF
jgi:hypothetical protein